MRDNYTSVRNNYFLGRNYCTVLKIISRKRLTDMAKKKRKAAKKKTTKKRKASKKRRA